MPRIEPLAAVPAGPTGPREAFRILGPDRRVYPMRDLNVYRTLAKNPKINDAVNRLDGFLNSGMGFPPLERVRLASIGSENRRVMR